MAGLESSLGVENGLVETNQEAYPPERHYIGRALARVRREVSVRVLNATHCGQKLTKGVALAHYEPVTPVSPPDVKQPQV
jgi:hypothetical protein